MAIANMTPATDVATNARPEIEAWLQSRGVSAEYESDFGLYLIDKETSLRNQARVGQPLIDEVVERYEVAMRDGAVFPPIVLYQTSKNKYVVVDGNHRVQAALRAETSLDAYVIKEASPTQITLMTYEANTRHGEPTSQAEREQQAMHLVDLGTPLAEAASMLGIKAQRLEYLQSDQEAAKRLSSLGYNPNEFGVTLRRRMHNVRSDVVLTSLARLALDTKMTATDIDNAVPRINAQRNEGQQISVVEEIRRERQTLVKESAGGSVGEKRTRPLIRINNIVKRIHDFDANSLPKDMDPVVKEQMRTALMDATRRLAAVLEKLS